MGTNKAEEYADNKYTKQAKEYAITSSIRAIYENCIIDFKEGYNSRQSEIDELTKEVEILEEWNKKYEDNQVENFERVKNQEHKIVELTNEVERLRKEREIEKMQIMGRQKGLIYYPNYVSFNLMSEEMAQKNHGQSLRTLNSRGGMSVMEILANIKNDRIVKGVETQDDINELNKLILNYPLPPINQ